MNVSAVTYSVGVKVGDWAEYDFLLDWRSDPAQPEPTDVKQVKQINYTRVEVKQISGTTVTLHETTHFKNESKIINVYVGDIKKGTGNLSFAIVASNLREGDQVSEEPSHPVINATIFNNYAGVTREVNYASGEMGTQDTGNWSAVVLYWDKKTGFLCQMGIGSRVFIENYKIESFTKWNMTRTNLWQPVTNPSIAVPEWAGFAVFVIIIICVIYFVFKRRPSKRLKRR